MISDMFIIHSFLILFQIQKIESLFVSIGDYSNESIPGLNSPECGLSVEPTIVLELSLNNSCFQRKYKNQTLVFFDKQNGRYDSQISDRVYNGMDVINPSDSPWAVHFVPVEWFRNQGMCTGVLITPYWVMTAAHCFKYLEYSWTAGVVLNMGSNKRVGTEKAHIKADSFHLHPMYTNPSLPNGTVPLNETVKNYIKYENDIALIRVDGFIPDTTPDNRYFINTICLPKRDEVNYNREKAIFYGYGRINDKKEKSDHFPEYLQMGWVQLIPYIHCDGMFCGRYKDDNPRPCEGDSGGPLVQFVPGIESRAVLVGTLQSASPANASCSNNIEYTFWVQTSKHIDWFLKTMKENFS